MSEHSILSPSAAGVWGHCTASVPMNIKFPEPQEGNIPAEEGNAVHWAGERMIHNELGIDPNFVQAGMAAPNGIVIDREMYESAEMYAEFVTDTFYDVSDQAGIQAEIVAEHRLNIHAVHQECFGTLDCRIWSQVLNELHVFEYKNGHLFVDEYLNKQGICYIAGSSRELPTNNDTKVFFHVIQPRCYSAAKPIRTWETTLGGLSLEIGYLVPKAAQALGSDPQFQTGPHCRFCFPRFACPAALRAGVALYEEAGKIFDHELSPEALSVQIDITERAIEQLKALNSGYSEQAKRLLSSGKPVPGWSLKSSQGRESWTKPVNDVIKIGRLLGFDLNKPSVKTPAQARKLGMDENIIRANSERGSNGFSLVKSEDPSRVFGKGN